MTMQLNSTLISFLTDHDLKQDDAVAWRNRLVSHGIFPLDEAADLTDEAVMAAARTYLTLMFRQHSESDLMSELRARGITWSIDIPADYQQGAICY